MRLPSLFHEAWVSISANRLRTFLAMLGIVIGVGSVVLMVAVGTGSSRQVEAAIRQLGTNLLIINPGSMAVSRKVTNSYARLSERDAAVLGQLPSVAYAAAFTDFRSFQMKSLYGTYSANFIGTSIDGIRIRNWELAEGDNFSEEDMQKGNRVMVIGQTVASKLFKDMNPVGATVQVNSINFRIIGLLKSKGASLDGRDQDNVVFVPILTAQRKLWGSAYWNNIVQTVNVQVASKKLMNSATEEIRDTLRARQKLRSIDPDNFTVTNLGSITQAATDTTKSMSILLASIASISLVVGGIGIMNIMLVTVSERTREIGIRKAIGASERVILIQFLMEAIFIACVGSVVGLALGFGLGIGANQYMGVPVYFSMWSVVSALVVASGVGIVSGIYPAFKAAKLQPIEALRVA